MANLDASTAEALNTLLEDERASVEMEIAFANGATERNERDAFIAMGEASIALCCAMRDLLAGSGANVSLRINGIVLRILSLDQYDDRLRAFAEHQLRSRDAVESLLGAAVNDRIRAPLEELSQAQLHAAAWCERRAAAFAESRLLDFRTDRDAGVATHASTENKADTPDQVADSRGMRASDDSPAAGNMATRQGESAGTPAPARDLLVDSDS